MLSAVLSLLSSIAGSIWFLIGYLGNGGSFPKPLTPAREAECLRLLENGDINAKNELIEHNLRLVAHVSKKFSKSEQDNEDLISIGTIGLIKAVSSFKLSKNIKLATYAARCIENEILMYLRSTKKLQNEVSINDTIGSDHDGNEIALLDVLEDSSDRVDEQVELKMQINDLYKSMSSVLTDREAEILKWRFGLNNMNEKTQNEISDMMNISRSYVSRIEKKAIGKLRSDMKK